MEDNPGPHRRRWRRELLCPGRPPPHTPAPAPRCPRRREGVTVFRFAANQSPPIASILCMKKSEEWDTEERGFNGFPRIRQKEVEQGQHGKQRRTFSVPLLPFSLLRANPPNPRSSAFYS